MTMDKFNTHVVSCDECADTFDTDEEDFYDAVDAKLEAGWKVRTEEGVWVDICPWCSKIEQEKNDPDEVGGGECAALK